MKIIRLEFIRSRLSNNEYFLYPELFLNSFHEVYDSYY